MRLAALILFCAFRPIFVWRKMATVSSRQQFFLNAVCARVDDAKCRGTRKASPKFGSLLFAINPVRRHLSASSSIMPCRRSNGVRMEAESAVTRSDFIKSAFLSLPLAVRLAIPFAAAFRIGAALSVIGQPRMPKLEGPYKAVGARFVEIPGGCRAKVFYPAESTEGFQDAPYCTDGRNTSDGMSGLVGFRQLGLSFLLAHLATAQSGCSLDAPPVGEKFPLLVYSHGFGGNMDMATYLMRQIASFGIVVAALEHRDGTASRTVLANGLEQPFAPGLLSGSQQLQRRASELLAATKPGVLGKDLDIDDSRVFLGGHSYGGPSALLAASQAQSPPNSVKLAGLLLHDPALGMSRLDSFANRGSGCRLLSFTSDEYDRAGVRCGTTFHVKGGFHGNFVDAPLWAPLWVMRPLSTVIPAAGPAEPAELHAMFARTAAKFMDTGAVDMESLGQSESSLEPRQIT